MATHSSDHKKDGLNKHVAELLGTTPALSSESGKSGPPDIKDVSLRWFAGTILTGVTSITLMGGALMAAVDGQNKFTVPSQISESIAAARGEASDTGYAFATEKGDLPVPPAPTERESAILHLSTLTRGESGNRVRTRPFARLESNLARHVGDPRFEIPNFDPVTIFSETEKIRDNGTDEILYDAQVEDEIEIRNTPFPAHTYKNEASRGFSDEEIEEKIRRQLPILRASLDDGTIFARAGTIAYVDPVRFEGKPAAAGDIPPSAPFNDLVTIRSENVLAVGKTSSTAQPQNTSHGKVIGPKSTRGIKEFWVEDMGMTEDSEAIVAALQDELGFETLEPTHKLRLKYAGGPKKGVPDIISVYDGGEHLTTIARADDGTYVPVDEIETISASDSTAPAPIANESTSVYNGIIETALKHNMPDELARELIRIYAFDVDFRSPIKPEDHMEVFYSLDPDEERATDESEIRYTSLTLGDTSRRYYRFKTTDDGEIDYYDEEGRSAKKFLMRQPVPHAKFRSRFGWRRHPILRTSRLHKGVDWSAPRGTPIFAAGNGIVEDAKWHSGYGRWVKIQHANGYETGYAHMSRFAKGIQPGVRVRQGQVIGYVGSTGLSTGPHLHYEVIVNGNHVDPMRIRLPRGRVLAGEQLAAFERERNRIDELMKTSDKSGEQDFALNN